MILLTYEHISYLDFLFLFFPFVLLEVLFIFLHGVSESL